ncbi:hypothetical protein LNP74_24370 [Klebsiella pneumoniae subsp. pneumoniae]|nr:hypothetical protein [Klebsiella pneumoniae subsp. pneumoniae]
MFFDRPTDGLRRVAKRSIHTTGRHPGYSISSAAPFLQVQLRSERISLPSAAGHATSGPKTGSTTLSATPSSRISPTAKRSAVTPSKAAKPITITSCLTPGIVAHLTERQQTWFNFSQGVELPDPGKY